MEDSELVPEHVLRMAVSLIYQAGPGPAPGLTVSRAKQ